MSDFPNTIKIGAHIFVVELMSPNEANSRGRWGETLLSEKRIRIDESAGPSQRSETGIHELLHCIWTTLGLKAGDDEERVITVLAFGLALVWRDNPEVMEWIADGLTDAQRIPKSSAKTGTVSRSTIRKAVKEQCR